jgi:hypothetical protein
MIPKITRYLSKTILVSIPALFQDGACRPFTLLGAELHGLWLQSDELTQRLLPRDKQDLATTAPAAVFVPFAQIAGVLVATGPAPDQADTAAGGRTRAKSATKASGATVPER